jgi:DNA-binding PadR family transcriptional regulator
MWRVKVRQNHKRYVEILRRMTPEQRLKKAFELNEFGRALFRRGLERRHPELSAEELKHLEREQGDRWHNRTY